MLKNVEKMSINYSPNFNLEKRSFSKVKYLIFHYTGMKSENGAIRRLTNYNSGVSCHYLIKNNGELIKIVPELGMSIKDKRFKSVDFPDPEGPIREYIFPFLNL